MTNLLAVGLSNSVYLWNAGNSKVARLVDVGTEDMITSTNFNPTGSMLGVGTHSGQVQIWDTVKQTLLHTY
jgi:WD40 repeat protein